MVSAAPRGRPVPLVPATAEATLPLLAAICMTCNGEDYRGFVDHTESGTECQRWDLQHPHKHPYHPDKYRPGGAQPRCWHGACHPHPLLPVSRPGTPRRVWMTTTAATRMAPSSPGATPLTPRGSASTAASASAVSPRWWHTGPGVLAATLTPLFSGHASREASAAPQRHHQLLQGEGRRLPGPCERHRVGHPVPALGRAGTAPAPLCAREVPVQVGVVGQDGGAVGSTRGHGHAAGCSARDLQENYCRNPDGSEAPWCFTTRPSVRVAFCFHIRRCDDELGAQGEPRCPGRGGAPVRVPACDRALPACPQSATTATARRTAATSARHARASRASAGTRGHPTCPSECVQEPPGGCGTATGTGTEVVTPSRQDLSRHPPRGPPGGELLPQPRQRQPRPLVLHHGPPHAL